MSEDPHGAARTLAAGTSLDVARAAVILIHGRGAGAMDILGLVGAFGLDNLTYLTPEAAGRAWYPQSFLAPLNQNEPGLSSALNLIDRLLNSLSEGGIPLERTALVGFSQGACVSAEYAARNPGRYGALGVFSGGLIGPLDTPLAYTGDLEGTPVFLGCSDVDMHIPETRVLESAAAFESMGAEVDCQIYPGMAHTIVDAEIDIVRGMLAALTA